MILKGCKKTPPGALLGHRLVVLTFVLAMVGTSSLWSRHASAFICTRVLDGQGQETGPSLSWFDRQLEFTLHTGGTQSLSLEDTFNALRTSFATWQSVTECASEGRSTDIQFTETTSTDRDRIGYNYIDPSDNENLIIFRDDSWPHSAQGEGIIALTITTFVPLTGQLLDADIEFNSAQFPFTLDGSAHNMDLGNTAVHEVGHFLGLGHTTVPGATMTAKADFGDTDKRTLECDDRDAVVFKYPAGAANGYCETINLACGFCAPPASVTAVPTISVLSKDDGISKGCNAVPPATWSLLAFAALARKRRRRTDA